MTNYKELQQQYEFDVYPKRDLTLVKGKGAKLWDDNGNEYIDCAAGIGVANIGHGNEKLAQALKDQAEKLIICPGAIYNDKKALVLEKLVNVAPEGLNKAFLCNSGTEAVEAAFKFARYTTKKTEFISTVRGFHGRTMGALSATFKKEYREEFAPLIPGFSFVPYNNYEKLEAAVTENTAGIILELIQGEGGIHIADQKYIQKVRTLCDEKNIVLIFDEIQTGFCRTGKMFATDHYTVQPDILTCAKGIAGGFPVGAVLCADKITLPVGRHGTTYGGNPLACAAALTTIGIMEEMELAKQAEEKGEYFVKKVRDLGLSKVREVRNLGLMIGLELKEKVGPFLAEFQKEGIIVLPAGKTVLRLLPPLVISNEELDIVVEKLVKVLI